MLVNVPGTDLKDEEMIKLPINVINEDKGGWKHTLTLPSQAGGAERGGDIQAETGRYIRPIMLVRVERTGRISAIPASFMLRMPASTCWRSWG